MLGSSLNASIILKGPIDIFIEYNSGRVRIVNTMGSSRRCGGQGDLLCGVIAALIAYTNKTEICEYIDIGKNDYDINSFVGDAIHCALHVTRIAARTTYQSNLKRSMLASDIISNISSAYMDAFGNIEE